MVEVVEVVEVAEEVDVARWLARRRPLLCCCWRRAFCSRSSVEVTLGSEGGGASANALAAAIVAGSIAS